MLFSGADCGLLLCIAMDGANHVIGHAERAGGINLPGMGDRAGMVKYGWYE